MKPLFAKTLTLKWTFLVFGYASEGSLDAGDSEANCFEGTHASEEVHSRGGEVDVSDFDFDFENNGSSLDLDLDEVAAVSAEASPGALRNGARSGWKRRAQSDLAAECDMPASKIRLPFESCKVVKGYFEAYKLLSAL